MPSPHIPNEKKFAALAGEGSPMSVKPSSSKPWLCVWMFIERVSVTFSLFCGCNG